MPEFRLQNHEPVLVPLGDLGIIRVQGTDATPFLQGQLSNDLMRLSPERSLLAGYHNPQGRTIAVVRLLWLGREDFIAVLPRELAPAVATRLAKFVLRAKVKITDQSAAWHVTGLIGPEVGNAPPARSACAQVGTTPPRWLIVSPVGEASEAASGDRMTWHRLEVASGQAQVFAATTEQFVAQMLNLDVLEAVSFDKGCYTGQEVIARAHYRGRVKRRMQRFVTRAQQTLAAGDAGSLADGRAFKVVDAVQLDDGRCEFLAVAPLVQSESEDTNPGELMRVAADSLPLPYVLPE